MCSQKTSDYVVVCVAFMMRNSTLEKTKGATNTCMSWNDWTRWMSMSDIIHCQIAFPVSHFERVPHELLSQIDPATQVAMTLTSSPRFLAKHQLENTLKQPHLGEQHQQQNQDQQDQQEKQCIDTKGFITYTVDSIRKAVKREIRQFKKADGWNLLAFSVSATEALAILEYNEQAVGKLFSEFGFYRSWVFPRVKQHNNYFCSELVMNAFQHANLLTQYHGSAMFPSDVYKILCSHGAMASCSVVANEEEGEIDFASFIHSFSITPSQLQQKQSLVQTPNSNTESHLHTSSLLANEISFVIQLPLDDITSPTVIPNAAVAPASTTIGTLNSTASTDNSSKNTQRFHSQQYFANQQLPDVVDRNHMKRTTLPGLNSPQYPQSTNKILPRNSTTTTTTTTSINTANKTTSTSSTNKHIVFTQKNALDMFLE
jgi:hypothetical protein